jgi:hypothetical protein
VEEDPAAVAVAEDFDKYIAITQITGARSFRYFFANLQERRF